MGGESVNDEDDELVPLKWGESERRLQGLKAGEMNQEVDSVDKMIFVPTTLKRIENRLDVMTWRALEQAFWIYQVWTEVWR